MNQSIFQHFQDKKFESDSKNVSTLLKHYLHYAYIQTDTYFTDVDLTQT